MQMLWDFSGHLPRHWGCFIWVLVHPADALEIPHSPGTFTQTQGLLFSGFPHTTSCRCSSFSWDIYTHMGVISSRFSAHYIMQMLRFFSGLLPGHGGCFFRVFRTLHHAVAPVFLGTFSAFFSDIYLDMGVVFFGFCAYYIMQMLRFLWDIYTHMGVIYFGFSAHYIMQMLQFCSGYLLRHRGYFFRVFRTLHHAVAPMFLGKFFCIFS